MIKDKAVSDIENMAFPGRIFSTKLLNITIKQICFILVMMCVIFFLATSYYEMQITTNDVQQHIHNDEEAVSIARHNIRIDQPCIKPKNIDHLVNLLADDKALLKTVRKCDKVLDILDNLFDVDVSNRENATKSDFIIPAQMEALIRQKWLKNDTMLFHKFLYPKIISITNRWTLETTGINPLRALKPKKSSGSETLRYTLKIINETKEGCNFCNKNFTIMDSFGRIQLPKSDLYSAHNSFQFIDNVGLFIPGAIHNWMEIDYETFEKLFCEIALNWFRKVHSLSNIFTHPMLVFDIMPHAGASQVHPHIQGFLGKGQYLGKMAKMEQVAQLYKNANHRDYIEDYVNAHVALGLGFRYRTATILVPLDAQKDYEFVIIGTTNLRDWVRLLYLVHRTYIEELNIYCFSTGMAWPSSVLTDIINKKIHLKSSGSLMFAKIGSRGNCQSVDNDVSSLELYAVNSLSSDLYNTMNAFKRTFQRYQTKI